MYRKRSRQLTQSFHQQQPNKLLSFLAPRNNSRFHSQIPHPTTIFSMDIYMVIPLQAKRAVSRLKKRAGLSVSAYEAGCTPCSRHLMSTRQTHLIKSTSTHSWDMQEISDKQSENRYRPAWWTFPRINKASPSRGRHTPTNRAVRPFTAS